LDEISSVRLLCHSLSQCCCGAAVIVLPVPQAAVLLSPGLRRLPQLWCGFTAKHPASVAGVDTCDSGCCCAAGAACEAVVQNVLKRVARSMLSLQQQQQQQQKQKQKQKQPPKAAV
jgi:hypothetical protein